MLTADKKCSTKPIEWLCRWQLPAFQQSKVCDWRLRLPRHIFCCLHCVSLGQNAPVWYATPSPAGGVSVSTNGAGLKVDKSADTAAGQLTPSPNMHDTNVMPLMTNAISDAYELYMSLACLLMDHQSPNFSNAYVLIN